MAKYDEQFKLTVVQSYESGGRGFKTLAKQYGLDHAMVRRWVKSYEQHGLEGLRKKFSHYSAEFKLSVLQRMRQDALSARQAIALFNIRGGAGVIRTWECQYHEGGLNALKPKPRGGPRKMALSESPPAPPAPSSDARTLEDLRKENEYLRAEVAYLKKLNALVQAKNLAAQKKRS